MNTNTFEEFKFRNVPENEILSYTKQIQQIIENIFQSNNTKDIVNLESAMKTLHSFRVRFPKIEPEINATLFRLQEKSLSAIHPVVKHGFAVSLLTSFERQPASNFQDTQKLIHIIGDQDNLTNLMPMVQRMTLAMADDYEQKFKDVDKDMALARLLREFVSYCYFLRSKKNVIDANWVHHVTNTLAKIYPIEEFQRVAISFPKKTRAPIGNTKKLPKEASFVYHFKTNKSYNRLFQSYEKE